MPKELKPLQSGQVFGRLTIIKKDEDKSKKEGRIFYFCQCNCGNIKNIWKASLVAKKHPTKSCGCITKEKLGFIKDRSLALKKLIYVKIKNRHIHQLQDSESTLISFEDFCNLVEKKCFYCGTVKSSFLKDRCTGYVITYNGLDRKNSDIGYRKDNVVAACKYCNHAKSSMSMNEFKEYLIRIHNHQQKGERKCPKKIDLMGQHFGRLTVVGKSDKRAKNGDVYWNCNCTCGKTGILHTRSNLLAKEKYSIISCGCYKKEGNHITNKYPDRKEHIKIELYKKLKIRNKKLGFNNEFILSFKEYSTLIQEACFYCGIKWSNISKDTFIYESNYKKKKSINKRYTSDIILYHNGIDRLDSSIGYTSENSVPCCKYCNVAKRDRTMTEFLDWAEKTYQYLVVRKMKF